MNIKKTNLIKKEILLPTHIGDWTTFSIPKQHDSITISKSLSGSHKTMSEHIYNELLFFHQELIESFFKKLESQLNSHIDIETVSIELSSHNEFKASIKDDIYQCKFNIPELPQIDLILNNKTANVICHRLCGGNQAPTEITSLNEVEMSIISIINKLAINELSKSWKNIFPPTTYYAEKNYGNYTFNSQQSSTESIIIIKSNFKLLNLSSLSIRFAYSLETIEKLLDMKEKLSSPITESISFKNSTLNKESIKAVATIGKTNLTIHELESIEIGDVIVLDNHKINNHIELLIGDNVKFNVLPVKVKENKVGVQILGIPEYENYVTKNSLPQIGPLIHNVLMETETKSSNQPLHNLEESQTPYEEKSTENETNHTINDLLNSESPKESDDDFFDTTEDIDNLDETDTSLKAQDDSTHLDSTDTSHDIDDDLNLEEDNDLTQYNQNINKAEDNANTNETQDNDTESATLEDSTETNEFQDNFSEDTIISEDEPFGLEQDNESSDFKTNNTENEIKEDENTTNKKNDDNLDDDIDDDFSWDDLDDE